MASKFEVLEVCFKETKSSDIKVVSFDSAYGLLEN